MYFLTVFRKICIFKTLHLKLTHKGAENMKKTSKKRTVLVTGANHGLGLSLTKVFLDHGYVVFAGVYKLNAESQIQSIKDREGLYLVDMDVSDTQSVDKAAEYVKGLTDSLDILINNAGVLCKDSYSSTGYTIFDRLDVDSMMDTYNINALGPVRVTNAFSSLLIKGDEKLLINLSSDAASIVDCGRSDWFGYNMSKTALNMAGAIIHNEFVKHGGRVWQIHPGWMQTYMHGEKSDHATQSSDFTADHIYNLIENADSHNFDSLVFMDILGKPLPW
jgi:NAD(P)-dependent dehydrogenase (short-subunit alcohol dehydrogenase family)